MRNDISKTYNLLWGGFNTPWRENQWNVKSMKCKIAWLNWWDMNVLDYGPSDNMMDELYLGLGKHSQPPNQLNPQELLLNTWKVSIGIGSGQKGRPVDRAWGKAHASSGYKLLGPGDSEGSSHGAVSLNSTKAEFMCSFLSCAENHTRESGGIQATPTTSDASWSMFISRRGPILRTMSINSWMTEKIGIMMCQRWWTCLCSPSPICHHMWRMNDPVGLQCRLG